MIELENSASKYSAEQTVFLWSKNERTRNIVHEICKRRGFKIFDATDRRVSETDWLAAPFFVIVLDRCWYVAHQEELAEYHKTEAGIFVEIVIGEDFVANQDPRYFIPLLAPDFQTL